MLNIKFLCTALVAAFASLGLSAHAQDRDDVHRDRDQYQQRHDHYGRDGHAIEHRGYDRHDRWAEHRDRDARVMGGPEHRHWRRGDRLPDEYRHGDIDWRSHHLHRPPRGYQWVEVDGSYALIAPRNGVIVDLIVPR